MASDISDEMIMTAVPIDNIDASQFTAADIVAIREHRKNIRKLPTLTEVMDNGEIDRDTILQYCQLFRLENGTLISMFSDKRDDASKILNIEVIRSWVNMKKVKYIEILLYCGFFDKVLSHICKLNED